MMENLEHIENFFQSNPTEDQKKEFDQKVISDPAFAEDVAFYLSARQSAIDLVAAEKKENFRKLYNQSAPAKIVDFKTPVRKLWRYVAVAAVLASVIMLKVLVFSPASPEVMASRYEKENFKTLGVNMGAQDSIQRGRDLYNAGKNEEAIQQFESILAGNKDAFEARRYVGIAYLETKQYDKALESFKILAAQKVQANPGIFYQAITLLKRNAPGDKLQAKTLLEKVVNDDLDGKKEAEEWLKNW